MKEEDENANHIGMEWLRNYDIFRLNTITKIFENYLIRNNPETLAELEKLRKNIGSHHSDPVWEKNHEQSKNFLSENNYKKKSNKPEIPEGIEDRKSQNQKLEGASDVNVREWFDNHEPYYYFNDIQSYSSATITSIVRSNTTGSSANQSLSTQDEGINSMIMNMINQQQPGRLFNPYILQEGHHEAEIMVEENHSQLLVEEIREEEEKSKIKCNCHELQCSTNKCKCFQENRRCTLRCQCNSLKCSNLEREMHPEPLSSDDSESDSEFEDSDSRDRNAPILINPQFKPPDFSVFYNNNSQIQ